MKSVGIIAEYNPLHNGHIYHIEQSKKITGADCLITIISGNFLQRGEPAFMDKYTRTRAALMSGSDLVIELPVLCATGSAELFATGAVDILDSLKVSYLSFGTESDNLDALQAVSQVLIKEPADFSILLQGELKKGLSYPKARQNALVTFLKDAKIGEIISSPNNILAIEYLKALLKIESNAKPIGIQRKGNGYHQTDAALEYPSATLLRETIIKEGTSAIKNMCTQELYNLYQDSALVTYPVTGEDFSLLINYALKTNLHRLTDFIDVNESIANKINNFYSKKSYGTLDEIISFVKSKELSHTRISRCLIHILLGLTKDLLAENYCYGRILGMNETGRLYLNSIKKECALPLITKTANAPKLLTSSQMKIFKKDIFASDIYNSVVYEKYKTIIPDEYRQGIIKK